MPAFLALVEFEWMVASNGYTILEEGKAPGHPHCQIVVPLKDLFEIKRPFQQFPGLFKQFATLKPSPNAAVNFANRFGLLQRGPMANNLAHWFETSTNFADVVSGSDRQEKALSSINRILRTEIATGISQAGIVIRPRSLLAAMALQLGVWLGTRDDRIGQCAECGATWLIGPRTGHRVSRQYCSPNCREAARYRRKKERLGTFWRER